MPRQENLKAVAAGPDKLAAARAQASLKEFHGLKANQRVKNMARLALIGATGGAIGMVSMEQL